MTTLRDNSVRSLGVSEPSNMGIHQRPKLQRHAGGNEAAIAAIRAVAVSEKDTSNGPRRRQGGVPRPLTIKQNLP